MSSAHAPASLALDVSLHLCRHQPQSASAYSSPSSSPLRQYTPPVADSASYTTSTSSTSSLHSQYYQSQQSQQLQQRQWHPYPSPPPTMHAQHQPPPQQLPSVSSILSSTSSPSYPTHQYERQRTRSLVPPPQPYQYQYQQPSQQPQVQEQNQYTQPSAASNKVANGAASMSTASMPLLTPAHAPTATTNATAPAPTPSAPTPEFARKSRARTAEFVAHNTAAMVCYLWFGRPSPPNQSNTHSSRQYSPTTPTDPHLARLQFVPSQPFVDFMHSLLTTTQVSQSVIVISLHYIYRLKCANPEIRVMEGSEMRLAVAALMLANKFLDDNTYTNQTWSQISHISLQEINLMEREFLAGVGFNLFVDLKAYEGWQMMLGGLMWAKEQEYEGWRRTWAPAPALNLTSNAPATRQRSPLPKQYRARSSSPKATAPYPFTFTVPAQYAAQNPFTRYQHQQPQRQQPPAESAPPPIPTATRPVGAKRSAVEAALSPDVRMPHPNKRPLSFAAPASASMMDFVYNPNQLHYAAGADAACDAFGRMSLEPVARNQHQQLPPLQSQNQPSPVSSVTVRVKEEDVDLDLDDMLSVAGSVSNVSQLAAPYKPDERLATRGFPKWLAFNTLVASPSVMVDGSQQQAPQEHPQMQLPPLQPAQQQHAIHIPPPQHHYHQEEHRAYSSANYSQHQPQRKTVTRYQVHQPLPQLSYPHHHQASTVRSARTSPVTPFPPQQPTSSAPYYQTQPHNFANAGPPGYQWGARSVPYAPRSYASGQTM